MPTDNRFDEMSLKRRIGQSVVGLLLVFGAMAAPGVAQTWQWDSMTHAGFGPPLHARSTVALTASEIAFTYTATAPSLTKPVRNRRIVIASCRAALSDVAHATATQTGGRVFLLIELKQQRLADCASGKKEIAALPGEDFAQVSQIAAAVNRACCSPGAASKRTRVAVEPSASPSPRPKPSAAASPSPSPSPAATAIHVADWAESQGLFVFVRVRNVGAQPVTVGGEVLNCKNVDFGCGAFSRKLVGSHATVTVATIATTDQRHLPSFTYRYTASADGRSVSRGGSSTKGLPPRLARISAQESRAAQATAISGLRGPVNTTSPNPSANILPARLLTRGSSRLGIGEKGVALVRVLVGTDGTAEDASIVTINNNRLRAAAIEVAVSSTYASATKNGQPVASNYIATFAFDGEDPANASVPVWRRSPLPPPLPSPSPNAAVAPATPPPPPTPASESPGPG